MNWLSLSAALTVAVQGSIPFELKFLEVLYAEIKNERPADPALLIEAAEFCQQMLSTNGQTALPAKWKSLIEDEPSFMVQREGALTIYIEEDEETGAGCMTLAKPSSQQAVEEAFLTHFNTSAAKQVEMGALKLPAVTLSDAVYDYEFVKINLDLSATSSMKDGLIIGVSYKEEN